MTIEIFLWILIGIGIIGILLLISILKGIANIMDQQGEIFNKHSEWTSEIFDLVFKDKTTNTNEEFDTTPQQKEMIKDALVHFDVK